MPGLGGKDGKPGEVSEVKGGIMAGAETRGW